MEKAYDIVAIGVAAVDDLLYVPAYPAANTKVAISRSARHPGGLATTAAAAAARLGGKAAYLARFGESALATYMKSTLAEFHVDISHILPDPVGEPFHSTIIVDEAGARTILYDCSNYRPLCGGDVPEALVRRTRLAMLDYLQDPPPMEIARKFRAAGVPILGDIEGRSKSVLPLLPLIDHLIVSEEFGTWASGTSDLAAACEQLAATPRTSTVITAGPRGCYLCAGPGSAAVHIPAFQVEAMDTTGCGDTFHGAFALAAARGFAVTEAARFASAAAALKATGRGGWEALPTAGDVLAFMRSRQGAEKASEGLLARVAGLCGGNR